MRMALEKGGLSPEDVDYVNAHGTSTAAGDPVEIGAIRQLVGERARGEVMVSSTKSMHGHGMGAAGGFEAVLTALAMREGRVPPTINLDNLDEACAGVDHVRGEARAARGGRGPVQQLRLRRPQRRPGLREGRPRVSGDGRVRVVDHGDRRGVPRWASAARRCGRR